MSYGVLVSSVSQKQHGLGRLILALHQTTRLSSGQFRRNRCVTVAAKPTHDQMHVLFTHAFMSHVGEIKIPYANSLVVKAPDTKNNRLRMQLLREVYSIGNI